jgi:enolase-phosphatase E1
VGSPCETQTRVILLDIEGTTTAADFVYRTLFPYAERKLESFLREHWREFEIQALVRELDRQRKLDMATGLQPPVWVEDAEELRLRSAVEYSRWLMARDSKCAVLKALQGKIWQHGYANGELRGEVYADVPLAFARWQRQGKKICIYSSGSEPAQRLLFGSVDSGDLTPFIAGYFDTRVGAKGEPESYRKIAGEAGHAPEEFLFISDTLREVEAARSAGMRTMLCVRGAPEPKTQTARETIANFEQIFPD